jgi:hypothetical protein
MATVGKLISQTYKSHGLQINVQLSSILGNPLCYQSTIVEHIITRPDNIYQLPNPEPVRRPIIFRATRTMDSTFNPYYRSTVHRKYLFENILPSYHHILSSILATIFRYIFKYMPFLILKSYMKEIGPSSTANIF